MKSKLKILCNIESDKIQRIIISTTERASKCTQTFLFSLSPFVLAQDKPKAQETSTKIIDSRAIFLQRKSFEPAPKSACCCLKSTVSFVDLLASYLSKNHKSHLARKQLLVYVKQGSKVKKELFKFVIILIPSVDYNLINSLDAKPLLFLSLITENV